MAGPTYTTTIRSIRDVAPAVREFVLDPPSEPIKYEAGQWLSLHLPVDDSDRPLVRAYSLAAPPSPSGELVLCLDLVPEGLGSEYLFKRRPGDEILFGGPLGRFVLPEGPGQMLWIARYTGIVPFRAMLGSLERQPPPESVTLLYSASRPDALAYHPELLRAAEERPWFELIALVDEPCEGWAGLTGDVFEHLPRIVGSRSDLVPMVCGTQEFVRPVRDWFYERGYDRRAVKWENYD